MPSLSNAVVRSTRKMALAMADSRVLRGISRNVGLGLRKLLDEGEEPLEHDFEGATSLSVHVHGTDPLAEDPLIFHPVVRVTLVDGATGEFLKKEDSERMTAIHQTWRCFGHRPLVNHVFLLLLHSAEDRPGDLSSRSSNDCDIRAARRCFALRACLCAM